MHKPMSSAVYNANECQNFILLLPISFARSETVAAFLFFRSEYLIEIRRIDADMRGVFSYDIGFIMRTFIYCAADIT